MSKLLIVPLKKPADVDIVKPLTNLIKSSYSDASSLNAHYTEAVIEFSKQRNTAVWKFFEKYESSLDIVYSYFDQLCFLETKISVQELQIPFKWKDAFDKGSIFGSRISLTHTNLAYEKVCVLFNIAALQSAVAASQPIDSDDKLKLSAKLLQLSAGIFQHLKGASPAAIPSEPTPDLNPETLGILSSLMIAQAQEVFITKAIRDNMKDVIIAKLCCQAEELFSEVLQGMQKENLRNLWEKDWICTIAGKQAGFHGMYQFYQSLACRSGKKVGEEISRLQEAVDFFKVVQSRSGSLTLFEEYASRAQRNLNESKKDNDFIYNEMIPDVKSLSSPGKVQLAKALPISSPMNPYSQDLFSNLIPVVLHQALTAAEVRKNDVVNAEIMKLRGATQSLNGILSSLNLPAAIEGVDMGSGLPPSLLEKSNDLKDKGGIESINKYIKELPELLTRNREILDEAERMLDDERDSDNQLRAQFKDRWSRISSEKLTEMFRSNSRKYREVINNAIEADKIVRQKFEKHITGIELLSMNFDQIQETIPLASANVNINSGNVEKLKSLMESVEIVKAERDVIESELKSGTVNIKEQFLKALAQDGVINEPAISVNEIGKVFSPLQYQVQESIDRQKMLILDIQDANKKFVAETGNTGGSRENLLSELASAYDNFIELQSNLQEGTKFYNDLTQLLLVFQNKISDFCFARKTEKEELLKDLTTESSRQNPGPTPSVPSHYSTPRSESTDSNSYSIEPVHNPVSGSTGNIPYPAQVHGMPMPYGTGPNTHFSAYVAPPMPQGFNPYATLPYPNSGFYTGFPQGPQPGHYGTYPGSYAAQQQGGYLNTQKPPGW